MKKQLILIADDEPAMLKLYAGMFSGTGYSVTMAASVAEARGLIEANDYDLLVADLVFPDGRGTELVKLFAKKRAGAKSLLVTGSVFAKKELAGVEIYECLHKPFKAAHFMSTVKEALGGED